MVWGEGVQEDQCEGETFLWQLVSPPYTHYTHVHHLAGVTGHWVSNTVSVMTVGTGVQAADDIMHKHLLTLLLGG